MFCQSNRELQIGLVPCDADNLPIHDQLQRELAKDGEVMSLSLQTTVGGDCSYKR